MDINTAHATSLRIIVPVVGWQFSAYRKNTGAKDAPNFGKPQKLLLSREPSNKHDPNAVAVYIPNQEESGAIGYIPKDVARWVAALIDAGIKVGAISAASDPSCIYAELCFIPPPVNL